MPRADGAAGADPAGRGFFLTGNMAQLVRRPGAPILPPERGGTTLRDIAVVPGRRAKKPAPFIRGP